jgi:hypothetical protein
MVAEDFLQDPQVRKWLDGAEPTWTPLTFDSLRLQQILASRTGQKPPWAHLLGKVGR